jgi:hypothetical protein
VLVGEHLEARLIAAGARFAVHDGAPSKPPASTSRGEPQRHAE